MFLESIGTHISHFQTFSFSMVHPGRVAANGSAVKGVEEEDKQTINDSPVYNHHRLPEISMTRGNLSLS
jgi:hypothetical protein